MSRAVIFANGELNPPYPALTEYQPGDWFIAADGGARHCRNLGITPHYLIGDIDSLESDDLNHLQAKGVQILRYSTHKNETDLELALLHAVNLGVDQINVYAALGARWDMTLANLLLLTHPAFQHLELNLIDGRQVISLLREGRTLELNGRSGDIVSLLPLSPEASGITTQNLEYALQDGTLTLGSPRGVSNVMLTDRCLIKLEHGYLAVIHLRTE